MPKQSYIGYLAALGATAIWSGNFVIARDLSTELPPVTIAFWRWVVAFLVFSPFVAARFYKKRKIVYKNLKILLACGFLGVTAFNTMIYVAGHSTTTINMSLISITFPVFMVLISAFFLGQSLYKIQLFGIGVVLFGVLLTITRGDWTLLTEFEFQKGDIWMVTAAVLFAMYSLLLRYKPVELDVFLFLYATIGLGLLMLFPVYIWEKSRLGISVFSPRAYGSIAYVGIFASLVAYIFWDRAMVSIGPVMAGIVYYTMPIFSGLLGYLILGEPITWLHVISAALIIGGILISRRSPQ